MRFPNLDRNLSRRLCEAFPDALTTTGRSLRFSRTSRSTSMFFLRLLLGRE
ncbi:MAG: hypothetical protein Q4Q58_06310 [Thermoplasmata archaeon]|nr:hypothetical protein [Thermoplasmata archaeon]